MFALGAVVPIDLRALAASTLGAYAVIAVIVGPLAVAIHDRRVDQRVLGPGDLRARGLQAAAHRPHVVGHHLQAHRAGAAVAELHLAGRGVLRRPEVEPTDELAGRLLDRGLVQRPGAGEDIAVAAVHRLQTQDVLAPQA